ncbi:deleted in malignant brain tumors 1 protein, partial [Biomphalaria glabrata]
YGFGFRPVQLCVTDEALVVPGDLFHVTSPNFPERNYLDNTRCHFTFKTVSQPVLLNIRIDTFYLEPEMSSCSYDSLCINGVKFCGNWTKDRVFQYIVPADSSFTLDFKTDGSATYRGFQLIVNATAYNNDVVTIVDGGLGTRNDSLHSSPYTLYSLNYQNKCGIEAFMSPTNYPPAYTSTTGHNTDTTPSYQYTSDYPFYDSSTYYQYSTSYTDSTSYPWYSSSTNYPNNNYTSTYYPYTTGYPWYYSTTYYPYSTSYPYNYDTTTYYPYSTSYPWYYSTTYYPYSTSYPYNYDTTTYYPYSTSYPWYYSTTYSPYSGYSTWNYDSTNAYQYTTGYPWYYTSTYSPYTSSPSRSTDYTASLLQQALQQIISERPNQEQTLRILNQILENLGY